MIINFPKLGQTEGGGGGDTPTGDASLPVRFLDYDGTVVYSYTKGDFASLSALPANPSHDGLTAQGWNWSLADAQAYVAKYGVIDIGQMYITDDGKTRLYLLIDNNVRLYADLYFSQTVANGVTVNWGDGSTPETTSGTGNKNLRHTYAEPGDYVITLSPAAGCTLGLGSGSSNGILGPTGSLGGQRNRLRKMEIGAGVTELASSSFYNLYSLASITLPSGLTKINSYVFANDYALKCCVIPSSVTQISSSAFDHCSIMHTIPLPKALTNITNSVFQYCSCLGRLVIPPTAASIGSAAVRYATSLEEVIVPESVTSIDANAFNNGNSLKNVYLFSTTPPTIQTTSFANPASDLTFYVPAEAVDTYKAATNWSNLSARIQPMPES